MGEDEKSDVTLIEDRSFKMLKLYILKDITIFVLFSTPYPVIYSKETLLNMKNAQMQKGLIPFLT